MKFWLSLGVVVPGGPDGQEGDLGVGPARAVVLDKVRDHLDEVPVVPEGPDGQEGDLGVAPPPWQWS